MTEPETTTRLVTYQTLNGRWHVERVSNALADHLVSHGLVEVAPAEMSTVEAEAEGLVFQGMTVGEQVERHVLRDCAEPGDHTMHIQSQEEDDFTTVVYLCPGGRRGDRRIRQAASLAEVIAEVRDA